MPLATDLRAAFPPPHPAGRPFILGCLAVMAIGLFISLWLTLVGLVAGLFCLFFFSRSSPCSARASRRHSGASRWAGRIGRARRSAGRAWPWTSDQVAHFDLSFRSECPCKSRTDRWDGYAHCVPAWRLSQREPGQSQRGQRTKRDCIPIIRRKGTGRCANRRSDRSPHLMLASGG